MPDSRGVPGFMPAWSLPAGVCAWQSTRGVGALPYGGFNLGSHVGDAPEQVQANRHRLLAQLPASPIWLNQVHGIRVLELPLTSAATSSNPPEADAVMTQTPGIVCAVMTADCLPVLLSDKGGRVVGAAHAGWRGLAAGVLEALVGSMASRVQAAPDELLAWLGPAIGPDAFEVGDDVREAFIALNAENRQYFKPAATARAGKAAKWLADLSGLASAKLQSMGLREITQSGLCTYTQADQFYSYRRDNVTGRMASMIWINR